MQPLRRGRREPLHAPASEARQAPEPGAQAGPRAGRRPRSPTGPRRPSASDFSEADRAANAAGHAAGRARDKLIVWTFTNAYPVKWSTVGVQGDGQRDRGRDARDGVRHVESDRRSRSRTTGDAMPLEINEIDIAMRVTDRRRATAVTAAARRARGASRGSIARS